MDVTKCQLLCDEFHPFPSITHKEENKNRKQQYSTCLACQNHQIKHQKKSTHTVTHTEQKMGDIEHFPLFETKQAKGRTLFKVYAASMAMGICLICVYRATHTPEKGKTGRYLWIGLFMAELWFTFYWLITQLVRWNPVTHQTFKDQLSLKSLN